ncbi:ATP-binding protein, partial [Pelomicrobium sp. G1]
QCATVIKTVGMTISQRTAQSDLQAHEQAKTIFSIAGHLYDLVHRMIRNLRPSALDHLGLPEALQDSMETWRAAHPE